MNINFESEGKLLENLIQTVIKNSEGELKSNAECDLEMLRVYNNTAKIAKKLMISDLTEQQLKQIKEHLLQISLNQGVILEILG